MRQHIVNVRFGPQDNANLQFLSEAWNSDNNSDIIRQALQISVQRIKEQEPALSKRQILQQSTFVASFDGDEDLSQNYKKKLRQNLKKKAKSK